MVRCIDCKYHRRIGIIERLREGAVFRKEKYFTCSYKKTRMEIIRLYKETECESFAKIAALFYLYTRFKAGPWWGPPK